MAQPAFRIAQLACGKGHTLALQADGRVLGFGLNDDGQVEF